MTDVRRKPPPTCLFCPFPWWLELNFVQGERQGISSNFSACSNTVFLRPIVEGDILFLRHVLDIVVKNPVVVVCGYYFIDLYVYLCQYQTVFTTMALLCTLKTTLLNTYSSILFGQD